MWTGADLEALLLAQRGLIIDGDRRGEKVGDVSLVDRPQRAMHLDLGCVHGMQAIGSRGTSYRSHEERATGSRGTGDR
jgi:hypothetical protein